MNKKYIVLTPAGELEVNDLENARELYNLYGWPYWRKEEK